MTEIDEEKALFAQLEDVLSQVEEVENLQEWTSVNLANKYYEITEILMEIGQALRPETQVARDLHSERNACQIELRRRGVQL